MPELKSKEIESKDPAILGEKVHRKGDYWMGWSEDRSFPSAASHTSTDITFTSKEEAKRQRENGAKWGASAGWAGWDKDAKEGDIVAKIERLRTTNFIPHFYYATVAISGENYQNIRVVREQINFTGGADQSVRWLNRKQLLSDMQTFLMQNPKGIEWVREMEEKDNRLFGQIKPKD